MFGMAIAVLSGGLFALLAMRRIILGPEEGGIFTLFALLFFLIGIALFGIGLLGEYIGRIYQEVRERPRYLVRAVLERPPTFAAAAPTTDPQAGDSLSVGLVDGSPAGQGMDDRSPADHASSHAGDAGHAADDTRERAFHRGLHR